MNVLFYLSNAILPFLMALIISVALVRKVHVYDAFISGAKEGFDTVLSILPHLIGMLVAVQMFTKSGLLSWLIAQCAPFFTAIGVPVEVVPLALLRPVSGAASSAVMLSIFDAYGPDSFLGRLASIMQGSTDTTLYVLTVYFGAVGIRHYRYALKVGLLADLAGLVAAIVMTYLFFG
ncbi:MAG: spore maturation protein [Candidatus Carbobacillus altaicus]|uniref:Spore maturation protein B n=1 Tax=Candidatus Carbonibacillus altaicus TaxID=2163959 RepID=A0A2R6XZQ0_9BACL|nr:spore maturation protein [Candidatus Carbobacillus altaicus]PTQ55898.1 MAG: Spore maturation protein B [Candidatus Carbobacillus altaicus]PTQ55960.1 MAG: Spore maturation protein B [Candidatus Carbobacillus altaicus]